MGTGARPRGTGGSADPAHATCRWHASAHRHLGGRPVAAVSAEAEVPLGMRKEPRLRRACRRRSAYGRSARRTSAAVPSALRCSAAYSSRTRSRGDPDAVGRAPRGAQTITAEPERQPADRAAAELARRAGGDRLRRAERPVATAQHRGGPHAGGPLGVRGASRARAAPSPVSVASVTTPDGARSRAAPSWVGPTDTAARGACRPASSGVPPTAWVQATTARPSSSITACGRPPVRAACAPGSTVLAASKRDEPALPPRTGGRREPRAARPRAGPRSGVADPCGGRRTVG